MLKRFFAALLLAYPLLAHAIDYSDIWWNPNEPGWGVNFAQSDNFIFATFFLYGSNNSPTWYSGQMNSDVNGNFSGILYVSTGPYFGGSFNPAIVQTVPVGSVTFQPGATADRGVLSYSVNNVIVTKNVQRQTLTAITLGGTYKGALLDAVTKCSNASQNGTSPLFTNLTVTQNVSSNVQLAFQVINTNGSTGATCTLSGSATQVGQLFNIPNASYVCGTAISTTAVVSELKQTSQGIEGRWQANTGGGCLESAWFSAVLL